MYTFKKLGYATELLRPDRTSFALLQGDSELQFLSEEAQILKIWTRCYGRNKAGERLYRKQFLNFNSYEAHMASIIEEYDITQEDK